jgi:hypothetical protein
MDSFRDKLTVRDVKSALRDLPKGSDAYDTAYHAAMERIFAQGKGTRRKAEKMLAWLLYARRPLKTLELLHALAVEPGDKEIDDDNILEAAQLLTICAGLVTIDEKSDNVRFIHFTTQEYLQRNQETWLPFAKVEIARTCTAYLSINGLAVDPCSSWADYERRLEKFVLLDYAALHWGSHVNLLIGEGCVANVDDIITEAQALLLNTKCLTAVTQISFVPEKPFLLRYPLENVGERFSSSHWIGRFGLLAVVIQLLTCHKI